MSQHCQGCRAGPRRNFPHAQQLLRTPMTDAALPTHPNESQSERRVFLQSAIGLSVAALAVACGGGSDPPTVTLSAIPLSGVVGATITLSADAEDDDRVTQVRFYRVTSNSEELLATFGAGPYLFQTTIPVGASGSVSYMASVTDSDDQETDSNIVSISVTT